MAIIFRGALPPHAIIRYNKTKKQLMRDISTSSETDEENIPTHNSDNSQSTSVSTVASNYNELTQQNESELNEMLNDLTTKEEDTIIETLATSLVNDEKLPEIYFDEI